MVHKICLIFVFMFLPSIGFAQVEHTGLSRPDVKPAADSVSYSARDINFVKNDTASVSYNIPVRYKPLTVALENQVSHTLDLKIPDLSFIPGQVSVTSWKNGEITARGGSAEYPGLMQINNASFGIYQRAGNFLFYAGGLVNKYGYFRGLHTQYGFDGSITYQFSPKVSFTAFGTYYFGKPPVMGGGLPMSPAMAGYYGVSKIGGYVDYDAGERFGVMVGGQTVQQIGSRRYEAEPIVTPYLKFGSGKKKIAVGLPVGQILYGILRH